jgi:hypothetical protein
LVASSIERLSDLSIADRGKANTLADSLRDHSERLEREATENEPPEHDYEPDVEYRGHEESVIFDIGRLFSEL